MLIAAPLFGQGLTLRLVVLPRVPAKISDWSVQRDAIKAIVTNAGDQVDARFEAQLNRNNEMMAETRYTDMPTLKIPNGVSTYFADQIIPSTAITFLGDVDRATWLLPSGMYDLSVRLCSGGLEMGLCLFSKQKVIVPVMYKPPTLMAPEKNKVIDPEKPILFKWTGLSPANSMKVRYHIQIYELPQGATPTQILETGTPIFASEDTATQFVLKPKGKIALKPAMSYIWTVTPEINQIDAMVIDGAGRSEPFIFMVKE